MVIFTQINGFGIYGFENEGNFNKGIP